MGKMDDALKRFAEKKAERDLAKKGYQEERRKSKDAIVYLMAVRSDKINSLMPRSPSRDLAENVGVEESFGITKGMNGINYATKMHLYNLDPGSPEVLEAIDNFKKYLTVVNESRNEPVQYLESKIRF
jgi:hypothetical protein